MAAFLRIAVSGRELCHGKRNLREHLTGILGGTAAVRALFAGDAVCQDRNDQLGIPFQADDGKLAQGNIELSVFTAHTKIFIEEIPNLLWDQGSGLLAAAAVTAVPYFTGKYHGIQYLHGGYRSIVLKTRVVTAVYMGFGVFTAEHSLFGEYGQTIEGSRSAALDHGIYQNPVVEGYINTVAALVKGYILHIHGCMEQFSTADVDRGGVFQNGLASGGQVYSQVFNTVLIPAGIRNFSDMDGHGIPKILRSAALAV